MAPEVKVTRFFTASFTVPTVCEPGTPVVPALKMLSAAMVWPAKSFAASLFETSPKTVKMSVFSVPPAIVT